MMSKKQLIQLLQFILAWILLGLFIVFVMEESFVDFVLRYRLYLLIVSFSYFYYNSIEYEPDKKYELIRNVVLYGNVYLFLHVFFRPLLNISHQLFVLLGLIMLGLWRTTKLRSRWRYVLQIIGGVFSFFILISGMFYFYPEEPDIQGFFQSKKNEIKALGVKDIIPKRDAYIQIVDSKGSYDYEIIPGFVKGLSEDLRLSYPSLKKQRDEKVILITLYGDLIWIFPQSEIKMNFEGGKLKNIEKLNGKIGFLSGVFVSDLEVIGYEQTLTKQQQEGLQGIQDLYKYELVYYLKDQISESNIGWANNTVMYNIDGKIIKFLAKMFPVSFSKNLHNYNEFQRYFSRVDEGVDLGRYESKQGSGFSISSMRGNMKDSMNIGKINTYGWFKKPEKR